MHDLTGSSGCRLSQFSLSRPFMLSVLTLISLLCTTQCEQNLSHYTYSVRSGPSKEFVQLTCPLHYARLGDEVVYYKLNVFDQKPDLLRIVPINSDTTVESVHYPVHQWSPDLHIYCEIQRNSDGAKNIISRTDFIFNALSGPTKFVHEPSQTDHLEVTPGQPFVAVCPIENPMKRPIAWYRLPGYRLNGFTESVLFIQQLTASDVGTYYCAVQEDEVNDRLSVAVQVIQLLAEGHSSVMRPAILSTNYLGSSRYECPRVPNALTPVVWEQPLGSIHLGHYQPSWLISHSAENGEREGPAWCHFDVFGDVGGSNANEQLIRARRQPSAGPLIKMYPRKSTESMLVTLSCHWTGPIEDGQTLRYRWKNSWDDQTEVADEITATLIDPQIAGLAPDEERLMTCEAEIAETGDFLGKTDISLVVTPMRVTGILDLKETNKKVFSYESGEAAQITCDVDKQHAETGKDIVWTLNGGPLRIGMKRTDRLLTSILIIPNMSPEDEGVFTCEQQGKIRQIHLIEKSVKLELELLPESDTRWANAGENTEFRCRLHGRTDGNRLVDWFFIPAGTEEEIHVQSDVEITRPSATPSTSFLTIDSVQKYHEGQYVCRAFDLKKIATLVVKTREISVTPESVDARPGTTVRFLCELSVVPGARGGKLYWIRTDRRDLTPGKEEVIGSTGGRTLLIVKSLDWNDNGTVYMCTDGVGSVTAQLFVRDVCGPGYRACSSHECIESNRFCDGKEDCADGSDELQAKCLECGANEFTCEIWNDKRPVRNCYLQYWRCDGEDDCGNNFDEADCPVPSPADKCNGTHYTCPNSGKLIARAFMCDSVPDCEPDGEDEHECSLPTVIEPSGDTQLFGLQSGNLTLTCVVYGRPPPAINWRFNWGGLREGVDHVVNTTVVDCNKVISHLTLTNLEPHASGLYTCEAVNKGRTLAPDISVNVAKGGLCTPPMFNDAAWFEDMCHLCYCSGVTNRCQSAKGYVKSSTDKSWDIVNHTWQVRAYTPDGVVEVHEGVESTEQLIRFTYGTEHPAYLEGTFGLNGSLLTSYGYNLKFNLRQFGSSSNYLPGALVALHGKNKSAYWCPPSDRVLLYTLPVGYDNPISVRFNERDRWYSDLNCTQSLNHPLGRSQFMDVLRDVQRIGIRMKNYGEQVSVELQDMTLEYAIKSDVPGVWVAEVEQCECPVGYDGLSCEHCANGYEEDPNTPGSCRLRCACDQCDDEGRCLKCPGKRSGPRCEHCEPGFYRPPRSALSEDCIPCEKCAQSIAHTVKECIGSTLSPDDYVCKCQPKADGKVLDPECDQCALAKQQGVDPPPEAKCDEKPEPFPCNPAGTNEVSEMGECQCKDGYEGERCDQCSAGFFAFENRCLGCYCAGQTSDCKLAEDHYFVNVTMDNPFGYSLDVWLAQRTILGGLNQIQYTPTGQPRIERTPTEFIVRHPLVDNGIIHLAIQLEPPKSEDPAENDLPVYRNLYGGQMTFRLDSANLDANLLTQGEARVIVELESSRYGRVWTQAVFNTMTQRYEVEFDENWWPGGWKLGTPEVISGHGQFQGLTRAQLLRVLATTSAIGIVTSSGQSESLRGLRLRGLAIQVAQPLVKSRLLPGATQQPLPLAPVEICECPSPAQEGERRLSLSCEGCRDPNQKSIVRLEPFGEDFICEGCLGPDCEECPKGQFKYDVYTGERFDTCQTGLAIHTNRRRIAVEVGDPVVLVCRATSYRGGIATHDWIRPNASDQSPAVVTRRSLAPSTVGLSVQPQAFTQSMHHSEAIIRLNSVRKEDAGAYTCRVTGVGSIVEQPFYLIVYDKGMVSPLPAPEDDTLNQKYPLSVPRSKGTPQFVTYQMEADPSDKGVTIVRATLSKPSDLAEHRLIWLSANGSRIPTEMIRADEDTGEVEVRLATPYDPLEEQTDVISGYFIGKDPVSNPYWTPMAEPEFIESDKALVTSIDIIKPPAEVSIRFMEPYKIPVGVSPGKSRVRVEWRRVGEVPGVAPTVVDGEGVPGEFPEGMQQERNDLLIHAAAEQHEGIYEAVVYRGKDGEELGRFNVTIRVLPLNPGGTSHLETGEAKDLPGDIDEPSDVTETPPKWDFIVQGFTPEAEYCEYPSWTLVDYQRNTSTDVTHKVHRLSPSNFRVEYPLTSGIYLRFQCQPVPRSNLTGEIKFNITSDDPRIVFQSIYDNPDSTFPTRLTCMDLNPGQYSNLKISSDTMGERKLTDATLSVPAINRTTPYGLPARKLELDWRRVGEFDPFNDAGQFTCFANNTMSSGSKTLTLPSASVPVEIPEDPFTRVYIYSPDVFVSPESTVEVREGDQLRLYCQYDSRPLGDFHGWSSDSPIVQAQMQVTHRGYSSRIATEAASLDLHEQSVQCKFGDQQKPVRIKVIPKDKPRLLAMVTSDVLVGDRLIGTTGGDMELQCEVKQIGGRPSEIDRIDWFVQYANGIRRSIVKSRLAQNIELEDNGRRARFIGLSKSSTGAKVFCVVRPVDALTATQAYHPSPVVDLWIRPAKIAAHIEPQHGPGIVVGDEAETIRLSCVVTDMWRNRTVRDAVISWENRVTPSNHRPELGSEVKPTSHDMPWLVTRPVNRELIVGGLRTKLDWVGEFRCLAEDLHSDATAYSDWVRLDVRAGDVASRIPRLRIIPQANPTFPFYPTSVQCVDDNQNYPSEVTWIRQDESAPPEDVETQPNSATLHWKVGDVSQFDPRTHSGVYICRASNPYASTSQQYYFPQEMMPDEPIQLSEHRLRITSTVNEIFRAEEDPYTRVIQGHPFELVCTYYGHPPPPGGLRWSIERVNRTDQSITSHWMAMQGLRIKSGRQYWTQVGTEKFDETGKQTGLFQCAALNRDGSVYKLAQVRVELYKVNVKIEELADSGLIEGVEGENGVITCNAFDGYFDFILPEAAYSWEFEKRNGDRVHRNLLATTVRVDGNRIEYEGLSTAANGFRARCVAVNNTARYVSADFGFRVRRVSGEPMKRPETEPSGTRWAKGDGSEGVLLIITGLKDATGHASLSEGDDANLTCTAVDSVTNKPFTQGEFHFGWQLAGIRGEPVSTNQLAIGSVQMQSSPSRDAGYFLVENARSSSNPPQPTARILCLATRQSEAVTYVSSPIDYVVYPKDVTPDYKKERDDRENRSKILVEVTGLDSRGMLFATEGSVKTLKCAAVDRSKGLSPVTDAEYAWEFSRLDGMPVDTTTMVVPGAGTVQLNGDEATFRGLRQTSTVRGRCVVRVPQTGDEAQESRDAYYSPYFKFDIVDEDGMGYRDFTSAVTPQIPSEKSDIAIVNVTGLDKLGYLTGSVGQDTMLMCTAFNLSTNEPIDQEQYDVHYGWEFQQMDGLPAISSEVASDMHSNSVNGQLQLTHLKEQSPESPTRGRCVVELLPKDAKKPRMQPALDGKRIASPYFFINVPPKTVVVPEFVDVVRERYELTVQGLNEYGVLPLKQNAHIQLDCIVRDAETDTLIDGLTAKQTVGWRLPIYPSGQLGNLGDLARKVQSQGSKIYLDDVRGDAVDGLRGACWFYDGLAYYYSPYFPIVVPRSTNDGRVRVEVQEIGTDDDRRYSCAAYHTQTGTRLLNVSYQWVFTTKTGEPILPGYYFESIQSHENELTFQSRRVDKQLPEHLRDKGPVEGRCLVLYQPFAGDLNKPSRINVYSSSPFVLIQPQAEDPSRMLLRPDPLKKDQRILALVDGVDRGLVTVPEDGTVTLTCQATDSETMEPLENLSYRWEIQQRDGSSVSTSGVVQEAILVEGTGGNRLTLVGVRLKAAGLRGRCIVTNQTRVPEEAGVHELGLLKPGEEISSVFFDFNVLRTSAPEDGDGTLEYAGLADFVIDGDPRQFAVVIGGLDESGRLKVQEGEDVTLEVKLKDMATGELKSVNSDPSITHIGLETRYDNGQSAPFSALAETVKVHGKDGVIDLNKVRPGSRPPTQFRVVIEREELISRPNGETGVILEKKRVRYASNYVDVVALKEGEAETPGLPSEPEVTIFPVVDGLNECGNLPVKPGVNVALTCRPNDTRTPMEDLIYGWEIRHQFGQDVPVVNLLAKGVKQQGNRLYMTHLQDIGIPLMGRCVIIQTKGKCNHFSSPYFPIGPHGPGCGPSDPSVVPDIPGEPIPEKKYQVRIRIEGLNDDGQVVKEPGANVTLKCTALNATTNTPVPNSAIGWEFVSDTGEQLHAGQLASRYELAEDNELRLTHAYRNPNARGRCMVTLDQRVTLSSPYFTFNIQDEETKPLEPISPSYSDKRVRVEVSGLNDRRQISITRVGDDASLRCQAIVVASSSPLHPIHGVRYGWEWRYVDEDPVSTTNVAVSLEANRERLGLRGIRAPPGTRGRNVKGRCVVHVPASQVDPSLPADQLLVYGSDYFSIDVIKKPTTLDPDIIPLPGKEEDGIRVKVNGLDENGHLTGSEKESVAVNCEVRNATTNKRLSTDGMRAEYNVLYGWEFTDVTGRSIDSSLFADGLSTDANGELRLRGLSGPRRGDLPFKIRCVAIVSKRPSSPDEPTGPVKSYVSDFFAVAITRSDGSSTMDIGPGEIPPDITGKLITLHVEGLKPDGTLTAVPGETVELQCVATESTTGDTPDELTYGWELRRSSGGLLTLGLVANQVTQDGNQLRLEKLKSLDGIHGEVLGRCLAYRERQIYRSHYFPVKVALTPKGQEIEGDGRIVVTVDGLDPALRAAKVQPDSTHNLTCVPKDAQTKEVVPNLKYGWDIRYTPSEGAPEIQGSLGPFIEVISEHPNGRISVQTSKEVPTTGTARFRCQVFDDTGMYSSPYYRLLPDSPDLPLPKPEKPVYPRYRVVVDGLDEHGELSGRAGDSPTLKCEVFDALSGEKLEDVFYYWDIRRTDEEAVSSTELVTRTLESYANELRLDGLKPIPGSVKGRCIVTDRAMETWDASPYFYMNIAPDEVPVVPEDAKDRKPSPIGPKEANATDDRVTVTVTGLDENGNFVGKIGDDAELVCNAQVKDGIQAEVISRGWFFTDQSGRPVATENLADKVSISIPEGKLDMTRLRKPSVKYLHGQCVVETVVIGRETGPDGSELETREKVLFASDKFGISHTEDGTPSEDIVGKDVQGKKITVNVDGLQADNVLHAETGDRRTLTCFAKDSITGEVVPSAIYYWEFRDQVGRLIPMDTVAERVARKHNSIEFQHLRPTDRLNANEQRFGRCVVYDAENEHFYRSSYFHLNVRRPDFEIATGPDNRVEVHVKGITPDGILVAEEGETATLECVAFDKDRNENIHASTAVYQFQFTEAVPDSADVYGGHVARVIEQEPLESGGIKLTLEGLKSGSWHKGRCVVLIISEDDKDPGVPVRRYGSKYFWSGVTKPDEPREPPEETKNRPVVISGFTNDPLVLVKVDGVNVNDTITAKPGDDIRLRGYAIDVPTGKPIEGMKYSWDIRTLDNRPLDSNDLAESMSTGVPDDTLIINGYRPSGEGVQVRLIATATEAVKDLDKRGKKYASPVFTFQTSEPREDEKVPPPEPRNRYDPSMLQLEVIGLNPDGTLSRKEGEDVRLACEVIDRHTGMPIEDEFDFGWSIGTGPDGRPVALNNLAESVKIRKGQLELTGLQRTSPKSGGLRSYCTVRLGENQLLRPEDYPDKTVSLNSDSFVIHVEPPDDVQVEEPEEKDIPPFINWIPGKDPKNAVIVKVFGLDQDGSVDVNPGGNLTLSCMALDAVSLQKIVPTQTLTPIFTWELRNIPGGQLLDYGHVTNGEVSVTQPSPGEDSSRLELHGFRHTPEMGSDFVGRCTVRLKEQLFRSDYFRIEIEGSRQLEDYETAPKDYWATDDAVKVIVNGLNSDGNLVTSEGSNANLNCEARDSKTNELLPPTQVNYGWQLIEPRNDALMTPFSETGHFAGPELQLNQLYLPEWEERRFILWGWCVVEVIPGKTDEGDKPDRYRSKPFMFIVQPKELPPDAKPEEVIPREELFVKVNGLTDDGRMKVNEGEDKTLECVAIETTTGRIHRSSSVNYGWEWRTLDGGIADVNAIAESVHSSTNQIQIKAVKPTTPIKGRCVVIARPQDIPPSDDSEEKRTELSWKVPRRYLSDFFFVDVEPVDPKTEEALKTTRPIIATDDEIRVEVDPTVDGEIQLQAGTSAKLAIVTKDKDGTPVQPLSTGYELVYLSGKVAQTGEIADEVEFTAKEGVLNLNKIRHPTRPVKLRVYVQMPPKEPAEGEVEEAEGARSQVPRIYYSEYLPIQVGTPEDETRPEWTDRLVPVYDVTGEKYKVRIVGLDDNGNAAGVPNESMELTCAVTDKFDFDAELKPNAYSWQFVDGDGHPLNPGILAEQVMIESGNKLRLIGYRSAVQQTVARGRCIINVQVPVPVNATVSAEMPPTQRYVSPYFSFTVTDGLGPTTSTVEPVVTDEAVTAPEEIELVTPVIPEEPDELKPKRFILQLDSPTNPLYELEDNKNTILARVQRPFELNCRAVFAADAGTERSSTGEHLPRLVWYYRQPEIPGDVPIPSQLFPVQPPRMETLVITPQSNHKISIESDVYSFRDDVAEFHCNAYMESDEIAAQKIVYIQKIKEKFNVRIFDEDSRSRVYAFVGSTKKLTCYVNDINSGDRVEPESYQWEVSTGDGSGEWLRGFSDRQPAEVVSGWTNNQLLLESLRLAEGTTALQTTYEFRCTVAHNATFDTTSRPFVMSVRKKPKIEHIRLDREKPTETILDAVGTPTDSYDATQDYRLGCKPEVTGSEAVAIWQKCGDDQCTIVEDLLPTGDKLFLFANSTRFTDEGLFRCQVSLQLKDYNFKLTEYRNVLIKRKSAPAIYSSDAIAYTVNDEMSLQCTDEASSPESTVEWKFEPLGATPTERKHPILLGKTYAYGRIYIFAIARGQLIPEHSGKYTCTATNPHGTASSTIEVTVTEELQRGSRRSYRNRLRYLRKA